MCADLCFSLHSVGVESLLVEKLTIVLQVSPTVDGILPHLKQTHTLRVTHRIDMFDLQSDRHASMKKCSKGALAGTGAGIEGALPIKHRRFICTLDECRGIFQLLKEMHL